MKKYSFLLSAFAHAQDKYASWSYPTAAEIADSLGLSLILFGPDPTLGPNVHYSDRNEAGWTRSGIWTGKTGPKNM